MAEQEHKQSEAEELQEKAQANPEAAAAAAEGSPQDSAEAGSTPMEGEDDAIEEEASLEEIVTQLQEDISAARDSALRAQADAQNVKRRAEQDVEKARKFALERFCSELLPVIDNMERALEAADRENEAVKPLAEGVDLTLKSFLGAMQKFNIEVVSPEGEPFDPNLHQAMSMVENNDVEPNTVVAVMQKGYTLNGRLVRPAMVMVSKAGG